MILYEIENMDKRQSGLVEFRDEKHAQQVLLQKGFRELVQFECYAGKAKDTGDEISVMKANGIDCNLISNVNQ